MRRKILTGGHYIIMVLYILMCFGTDNRIMNIWASIFFSVLILFYSVLVLIIELFVFYINKSDIKIQPNAPMGKKSFWKNFVANKHYALTFMVLFVFAFASPLFLNLWYKMQCFRGIHDFSRHPLAVGYVYGGSSRVVCSNCDSFANNDETRRCTCGITETDIFIKEHECFIKCVGKIIYLKGIGCLANPIPLYKEPKKHPDMDKHEALIDWNSKTLLYFSSAYMGDYTIPEGITTIGNGAFSGCSGLTGIHIPKSLKSIGARAFMDCTNLKSIHIPNGVVSIGDEAFWGCSTLAGISIPESVTFLGKRTFKYCESLKHLRVHRSYAHLPQSVFEGVAPKNITTSYKSEKSTFYRPKEKISYQLKKNHDPVYYELTEADNLTCLTVKKGDRISVVFSEIYLWYGNSANIKIDFNIAVDSKAIKWIWYFYAVADGPVTMNFKSIDSKKSFNIIPPSLRGTDTLFHRAAKNRQWLKMRYLLESGVQIDNKGEYQDTALGIAIAQKDLPLVSFLLAHKADPNKTFGTAPVTAYHGAVQRYVSGDKNSFEIIKYLTANGGDPNIKQGIRQATSLEYAVQMSGDLSLVKYMVEHGAKVTNEAIRSARKPEIRQYLIANENQTGITEADEKYQKVSNICLFMERSTIPLDIMIAVKLNNLGMLKFLSKKYKKEFERVVKNGNLFHIAAASAGPEMLDFLFSRGAGYVGKNKKGLSPIKIAVLNNNAKNVKWFIDHNADIESLDKRGSSLLFEAVQKTNYQIIKLLIEAGASCSRRNSWGNTPLHMKMAISGDYEYENIIDIFVKNGAKITALNRDLRVPLHHAVIFGNLRTTKKFLESVPQQINQKDKWGFTPLHLAAMADSPELYNFLISKGADDQAKDSILQVTPFQYAVLFKSVKVLKIELKRNNSRTSGSQYLTDTLRLLCKRESCYQKIRNEHYPITDLPKFSEHDKLIIDLLIEAGAQLQEIDVTAVEDVDLRRYLNKLTN